MAIAPDVRTGIGAVLGRSGDPILAPFPGKIDDVRTYNRVLSAEEIYRLYREKVDEIRGRAQNGTRDREGKVCRMIIPAVRTGCRFDFADSLRAQFGRATEDPS
jgi:hypothetical protein